MTMGRFPEFVRKWETRVVGAKFKMHSPYEEEDERGHEEGRDERGSDDVRVRVGGEQHKPVHG